MPKGNLGTSRIMPELRAPFGKIDCYQISGQKRFGWFLVIFLFIIFVIASINSSNKTDIGNSGNQTDNNQPVKLATQEDPCRSDWSKCTDNEQLVNHYSDWSHIQVECKYAANDRAKYGDPKWPWFPFGTFYKGNNYVTTGTAIAVEPDAQFSNGFGGMVHSRVTCTYDLRAKRVMNVDISSR